MKKLFLFGFLSLIGAVAFGDTPFNTFLSGLPPASTLAGTENIPALQGGATTATTPAGILTYVKNNGAGGANTDIQFNSSGGLFGTSAFTYTTPGGNPSVTIGNSSLGIFESLDGAVLLLNSGSPLTNATGANIDLSSAGSANGPGGSVVITAGTAAGAAAGAGGAVQINGGNATTGTTTNGSGGSVVITAGTAVGSGTNGDIDFTSATNSLFEMSHTGAFGINNIFGNLNQSFISSGNNAAPSWSFVTDSIATLANKPASTVVGTTNLTLSGAQTIDSFAGTAGTTIVLATAQSTGSQNGPWVMQTGTWTRPTWYASGNTNQAFQFITTLIRQGVTYQGSTWRLTTAGAITIDTTTTAWSVTPLALNTSTVTGSIPCANLPALTGDATTSGCALTFATVNGNVGSFTSANITVNGKGLITAASNGSAVPTAANPSASIGLTTVNGSASTFMRSDAAPNLSLAINPVGANAWTADHEWSLTAPSLYLDQSGAGTNLGVWSWNVAAGVMSLATNTDALGAGVNVLTATRGTTTAVTNISFGNASSNPSFNFLGSGVASFSGAVSTIRLGVTGTSAPTIGIYSPSANTLGFSSNTATAIGSWNTSGLEALTNISVNTTGLGFRVAEGSNAKQGVCTLAAGTCTVTTTSVTANSRIFLTEQSLGTVAVPSALGVSARTAGTSFIILASAPTDTSVVAYEIFEPSP